jgi:Protein of unknown function (DUF1759)
MSFQAFEAKRKGLQGNLVRRRKQIEELKNTQGQILQRTVDYQRDELEKLRKAHDEIVDSMLEQLEGAGDVAEKLQESIDRFLDDYDEMQESLNQVQDRIDQSSSASKAPARQNVQMPTGSTGQVLTVDQMKTKFEVLNGRICHSIEMINVDQVAMYPVSQLQSVLDEMTNTSQQLKDVLMQLFFQLNEEEGAVYQQKERESHKKVFETSTWLMNAIEAKSIRTAQSTTSNTDMSVKFKLPPIVIPKFNGSPDEWIPFRDLYVSMIHENAQLSGSQKFRFLKTSIVDKLCPIKMMLETDEGYEDAWKVVLTYYDNKRKIVDCHFNAILNAEKMTEESCEDLQNLINEFSNNLEGLRRLVPAEDVFEALVAHIVTQRLDAHTRDLWESENFEEIPTWTSMKKFLDKRRKVLCTLAPPRSQSGLVIERPNVANVFHVMSSGEENVKCFLCQESHRLMDCPQFLRMDVKSRFQLLEKKKLGFNCFSKSHGSKKCNNPKRCRSCDQPHHTLLHYPKNKAASKSNSYGDLPLFIPRNMIKESQGSLTSHIAIGKGTVSSDDQKTQEPPQSSKVLSCFSQAIHDTRIHQRCSFDSADTVKRQGFGEADCKEMNQVRVKSRWKTNHRLEPGVCFGRN